MQTDGSHHGWFDAQSDDTQEKVLAGLVALQTRGPTIGRPLVDTVNTSKYNTMKELRIQHRGDPIRAFFAFDPLRQAIVLCASNKGENDVKLSTIKRYIEAMDGKMSINIELPTGKHVGFNI
ncbi:type II toxin-antitoxin system RelE/ParE family toxin [Photobacterium iliopiscarium]|uniref:type II toxin-antitoxin system RelE/ParE family toxin n=1 Tax=Photobacterium iliopiscarium TaxID=56192 RepID=UPI0015E69578|nr:type II toxin-antitoxin system RelE/ParE family toxin [Photobacterium iliopiscarium]